MAFSQGVVGPGGVTTYGGGGRQHGGYVRVRDPGKGFFVGGSTLWGVNGVYVRRETLPHEKMELHSFQLAYENEITGWFMALVDAPGPEKRYRAYGDGRSEWLFIDPDGKDRFGHKGETIIPGSGERWGHLDSRYGGAMEPWEVEEETELPDGRTVVSNAVMTTEQQAEWHAARKDQLPWQVIMIGDPEMLNNLRWICRDSPLVLKWRVGRASAART